MFNSLKVWS